MRNPNAFEPDWQFTIDDPNSIVPLYLMHLLDACCTRIVQTYTTTIDMANDEPAPVRLRYSGWWREGAEKPGRLALQNVMHHYWPDRFPCVPLPFEKITNS